MLHAVCDDSKMLTSEIIQLARGLHFGTVCGILLHAAKRNEGWVLCNGEARTLSGPEGSNNKRYTPCAAGLPGPSACGMDEKKDGSGNAPAF